MTILIIDDDKFTRQLLCKILSRDKVIRRFKPNIIEAQNGMEGLRLYDAHKPVLAIVDLLMPKMDGFEVCKLLRQRADQSQLSIAVTSGVYKDAAVAKRIKTEFQGQFFAKPYQIKNIADFVAQTLSPEASIDTGSFDVRDSEAALSGSLKKRSAAKVLFDLLEKEKTGRLILRQGQVVRQIELYVGHPVSITTNVREETLGHFLVSKKTIDSETHRLAMSLAANKKLRFGEAIIEMGVLSAEDLIVELTAQTRFKLVNSLRWRDGTWSFRAGEPRSGNSNALNVVEVIVSGLAATAQLEPPPPSLTVLAGKLLSPNPRGQKLLAQIGASVSPAFASHFKADCTIDSLEQAGVNHVEIYSCLDVLLHCDGLEVSRVSAGPNSIPDEASDAIALTHIAQAKPRATKGPDLIATLFDGPAFTNIGTSPLTELGATKLWSSDSSQPHEESGEQETEPAEARRRRRRSSLVRAQAKKDDAVVEVSFSDRPEPEDVAEARGKILREFLRIQEKTLYGVLGVSEEATTEEIQAAYDANKASFHKDQFSGLELGRDFQRLNVLQAAYNRSANTLLDSSTRKRYDKSLQSTDNVVREPSMDAEIAFGEAEKLSEKGDYTAAVSKLQRAVELAPDEASYRAELGWAVFVEAKQTPMAADAARPHLSEALAADPDNVLANEYKGLIHSELGDDLDAALLHLGHALKGDARRIASLQTIEKIRIQRGEFAKLRQLYRQLLFRLKGSSSAEEALIWCRLGDLHQHYLSDSDSALIAFQAALKLTPLDESLAKKISGLAGGDKAEFFGKSQELQEAFEKNPEDGEPLRQLFAIAYEGNYHDGAFLAASALCVVPGANEDSDAYYQRFKARFLVRAQQQLGSAWNMLLASDDFPLLGQLYGLLAPCIQKVHPMGNAREEVSQADAIEDSKLPTAFREVRAYAAHVLGVAVPAIYSRDDYDKEIHVAALDTPVLLSGLGTITCADKLELAFRLGRAMSYLRPGRALVAGCPSSALKTAMLACYSLASPHAAIPDPDGKVAEFKALCQESHSSLLGQVTELVSQISHEHPSLNLSQWGRTLQQTANQTGLLLCGDLPSAYRCVTELKLKHALVSFAVSPNYMHLRSQLGLSIDV